MRVFIKFSLLTLEQCLFNKSCCKPIEININNYFIIDKILIKEREVHENVINLHNTRPAPAASLTTQ